MNNRLPLKTFPDMRAAHAAIKTLETDYLKAHKKRHLIDLTLSSTSQPFLDDRGRARMGTERIEVNLAYDAKSPTHETDVRWFVERAKSLT